MFQELPLELRFLAQKIAELFLVEHAQAVGRELADGAFGTEAGPKRG